jgi:hypothetical protein
MNRDKPPDRGSPFCNAMKKYPVILAGGTGLLLLVGIALIWLNTGATRIQLSGTHFTGLYIKNGPRVDVSARLSWSSPRAGTPQFEFRKVAPTGDFTVEVKRGGLVGLAGNFYRAGGVGQEVVGLHGQLDHWSITIQDSRHAA